MYNEYLNENSDIAVTYQQIKDRLENIKKMQDLFKINVMELATTKIVDVDIDDDVDEVARILGKKKIKKVPVVEEGKIVGIVSRSMIIRYIVAQHLL